jgi:hypothetical protein
LQEVAEDHSQFLFALGHEKLQELIWDIWGYTDTIFVELTYPRAALLYLDLEEIRI